MITETLILMIYGALQQGIFNVSVKALHGYHELMLKQPQWHVSWWQYDGLVL